MKKIIAVDVGTTTIRSVLYNEQCQVKYFYQEQIVKKSTIERKNEIHVEIDPDELFYQFLRVVRMSKEQCGPEDKVSIAITTQRNSIVLWNKATGREISKIICWNDGRGNELSKTMNESALVKIIHGIGAVLYYCCFFHNRFLAARKLTFIGAMVMVRLIVALKNFPEAQELRKQNKLAFGCMDSWLLNRLSPRNPHVFEVSNISSSGMYDPWINDYNRAILKLVGFPTDLLAPITDSTLTARTAVIDRKHFGVDIPIVAILADQQAAMFGSGQWRAGDVRVSMGTGTFVDIHTGNSPHASMNGLYPIVAWSIDGNVEFLAEGNDHDTASVLSWAQSIGLFADVKDTSTMAFSVQDSNGAFFVPAFGGLQTPINDEKACCGFMGLRPDTTKSQMVRAILEALCFRVYQIYTTTCNEVKTSKNNIRICGGVSYNDFICQCIADLFDRPVERLENAGLVAAKGVAMVAGLSLGFWTKESMQKLINVETTFLPEQKNREKLLKTYGRWLKAVSRCTHFFE